MVDKALKAVYLSIAFHHISYASQSAKEVLLVLSLYSTTKFFGVSIKSLKSRGYTLPLRLINKFSHQLLHNNIVEHQRYIQRVDSGHCSLCVVVEDGVFEEVVPWPFSKWLLAYSFLWLTFDFGVWLMNESEGSVVLDSLPK